MSSSSSSSPRTPLGGSPSQSSGKSTVEGGQQQPSYVGLKQRSLSISSSNGGSGSSSNSGAASHKQKDKRAAAAGSTNSQGTCDDDNAATTITTATTRGDVNPVLVGEKVTPLQHPSATTSLRESQQYFKMGRFNIWQYIRYKEKRELLSL
jgi:hypothetical protein